MKGTQPHDGKSEKKYEGKKPTSRQDSNLRFSDHWATPADKDLRTLKQTNLVGSSTVNFDFVSFGESGGAVVGTGLRRKADTRKRKSKKYFLWGHFRSQPRASRLLRRRTEFWNVGKDNRSALAAYFSLFPWQPHFKWSSSFTLSVDPKVFLNKLGHLNLLQ